MWVLAVSLKLVISTQKKKKKKKEKGAKGKTRTIQKRTDQVTDGKVLMTREMAHDVLEVRILWKSGALGFWMGKAPSFLSSFPGY